jgi:hypothetical protein
MTFLTHLQYCCGYFQTDHTHGVAIAPSSLIVPHPYLPPGQVTALHPFVMHQQGVPNSVASHVPQSHVGHFHPVPTMSTMQQWQNQQVSSVYIYARSYYFFLSIFNFWSFKIYTCFFRLFQRVCRYPYRIMPPHHKLIKI